MYSDLKDVALWASHEGPIELNHETHFYIRALENMALNELAEIWERERNSARRK